LYVVLMLVAPLIALIHRGSPNWLLPLSLLIYFTALVFKITIPTWPTEGQWFFNPLCWQLVFVLGFTMSREQGLGAWTRSHIGLIRIVAVPIVVVGAVMVVLDWWPDPTKVPEPKLLFIAGKTFVTPIRLIQFLALLAVFSAVYPMIAKAAPRLVGGLSLLGR